MWMHAAAKLRELLHSDSSVSKIVTELRAILRNHQSQQHDTHLHNKFLDVDQCF